MTRPGRVAVFASGTGTNLQALLDHFNRRSSDVARVDLVVASRAGIGAIERAERAGVVVRVIKPPTSSAEDAALMLLAELEAHGIDLIVLAGYLKLIPEKVVERFTGRMLNIHPALLPAFGGPGMYGLRVHRAVLEAGVRVTGATVHLVNERYDEGAIVAQWPVPVHRTDTPESLAERVLRIEHLLLPAAVERVYSGRSGPGSRIEQSFEIIDSAAPPDDSVRRFVD